MLLDLLSNRWYWHVSPALDSVTHNVLAWDNFAFSVNQNYAAKAVLHNPAFVARWLKIPVYVKTIADASCLSSAASGPARGS
jgi:hypothetical protein